MTRRRHLGRWLLICCVGGLVAVLVLATGTALAVGYVATHTGAALRQSGDASVAHLPYGGPATHVLGTSGGGGELDRLLASHPMLAAHAKERLAGLAARLGLG